MTRPTPLRPLIALAFLGLAPAAAQQRPLDGLDAYVARAMTDWRVPGLAIVVVKDDSVVFIKGYGVRELGKPDPVTVHTRFGNMSTTKAFTAMLVAMLADSGRVSLDDPVQKHIPGVQFADPYVTREITVRDLLTHRVGFGDPDYLWGTSGLDFAAITHRLRFVPAQTSFRSRFQYNNVTYALAGDVAAHAAGTTWQALLHAKILGPLGMTETLADASELRGISDVTAPHGIVRDTVRVVPAAVDGIDDIAPAGAIFSTATDMAKWLRFVLDSGKVAGRRLVSAPNFAELFRPQQIVQRPFYPTARLTHPHFQAYGLGWILQDYRGEFIAIHTGSIEGRSAIVGLIPDRRLGLAIFTNLDHSELRHALMYTVLDRFIGPAYAGGGHDWSAEMRVMYKRLADSTRAARQVQESKRITGTHPTRQLGRYTGTYADSLFGTATLGMSDGRLTLQAGTAKGQLEHWQYDVFRVTWQDPFWDPTYVTFGIDPDGSVGEVRVVEGDQVYRRVK